MEGPATFRIVLLGKSGNGKSSLANTIFGETMFKLKNAKFVSEAKTKCVNGKNLTLIDTPGLFDTERSLDTIKPGWERCIIECAPGPHVFLIVLKVEKYTEQEKTVVTKICDYFSDDALKYTAVVFTHGDQLPEGMKIEEYVGQSDGLRELVEKCGGRCHVFDNRYWKNNQEENYRSNKFQLAELLNNIDKIIMTNRGGHYSNTELNEVERKIQEGAQLIRMSSENMSDDEIRQQAKRKIFNKEMIGTAQFWIKGFLTLAFPILITVPVFRFGKTLTEIPLSCPGILSPSHDPSWVVAPILEAVKDVTERAVSFPIPVSDIVQVVEEGGPVAFEEIFNRFCAPFERLYNPFSPFE